MFNFKPLIPMTDQERAKMLGAMTRMVGIAGITVISVLGITAMTEVMAEVIESIGKKVVESA